MVEMVQYTPRPMRSKPGGWIVGSVTSDWLTTVADPEESHDALFELECRVSPERIETLGYRCWLKILLLDGLLWVIK